jgi:hypothetical protein
MSQSNRLPDETITSIQVWKCLSIERQLQIMRLLTQLALNLVLMQSNSLSKHPEVNHDLPTEHSNN